MKDQDGDNPHGKNEGVYYKVECRMLKRSVCNF